ncbi:MAG: zinc-binding dehydrogenase [Chloroflexi bacterium]|nr:zinc-binding dehydrogenase [Chloroflexota bacterium]
MKAVVFEQHGGPEVLQYREVPDPKPGPNDVLIKVKAASANYNDIWARRGLPGVKFDMPHVSGSDAAGVVAAVGSEVRGVKPGDEVLVHPSMSCRACEACTSGQEFFCRDFKIWGFQTGPNDGGHAEYARVPAVNAVPKPKNLTFEQAASLPLVLMTAWRMLVSRAQVKPGDFVLVWGGAGGLGTMAIQICKVFNARAIAVVSSDEKAKRCQELGAAYVVNRSKQDVAEQVRNITNRRGVDIVFEHVGQATFPTSIRSLRWGGSLVTCGATSGFEAVTDVRFLWNKQLNFHGSHMGNKAELLAALRFVESGHIKPVIDRVLPLKEVPQGQELMEQDKVVGKLVYVPEAA